MSQPVFLYLTPDADIYWWQDNDTINVDKIDELRFVAKNNSLIVIIDANDVVCLPIDLKTNSDSQLLAAAPFELENQLLTDIEATHFVLEPKDLKQSCRYVWAIDGEKMAIYLQRLSNLTLEPSFLVPESALINHEKSELSIWIESCRSFVSQHSATVKLGKLPLSSILSNLKNLENDNDNDNENENENENENDNENDQKIDCKIINFNNDLTDNDLPDSEKINFTTDASHNDNPLLQMTRNFSPRHTVNLLQGKYQNASKVTTLAKKWLPSLLLLALTLVLLFMVIKTNNIETSKQIRTLKKASKIIYSKTFSNEKPINVKSQMREKLNALSPKNTKKPQFSSDFLSDINTTVSFDKTIKIDFIEYKFGTMKLTITTTNKTIVNQLIERLKIKKYRTVLLTQKPKQQQTISTILIERKK